jgi:hypothetical protein
MKVFCYLFELVWINCLFARKYVYFIVTSLKQDATELHSSSAKAIVTEFLATQETEAVD